VNVHCRPTLEPEGRFADNVPAAIAKAQKLAFRRGVERGFTPAAR
jgi:hypothetical protein